MTELDRSLARLSTGIPGFDSLIEGGLPVGGVFLVEGEPGAGKTILGNQMCFHHASTGGQAVYLTLLAESHARMFSHLRRFAFFNDDQVGRSVHYHAGFRILEEHGLKGLMDLTRNAVIERRATLIVIDGLVNASEVAPTSTDLKLLLHAIQTISTTLGCTIVLLSSARATNANLPEHTVVDGIIRLTNQLKGLRARRAIEVRKLRGVNAVTGSHSLEITNAGMLVRPRLESRLSTGSSSNASPRPEDRLAFGIDTLDAMLHGGLPAGSNTLIVGPTGTGKTTLGLQYLAAGAERGENGLYLGFYERPDSLLAKSDRLGLKLSAAVANGLVVINWERPVEGILDALTDRLLTTVRETGVQRLCIDGLHTFERTVDEPDRIHAATAALSEELERVGVTTVSTLETPELFGLPAELPIQDMSAIAQNLLFIRHIEQGAALQRKISIIKMRDSDYDPRICDFRITDTGIQIAARTTRSPSQTRPRRGARAPSKPRKGGRQR